MKELPLTEDLSVLARRGAATPSELRRLEMLLGASPVERFLDAFGRDCDAVPRALPGDEALLARVVDRVARPARRRRGRRAAAAVGVAAALTFGSALAAAFAHPRWFGARLAAPAADARCSTAAPAATAARRSSAPPPPPAAASASAEPARAAPAASRPAPMVLTAAEAFARANALRRAGQGAAAVAAYWQLQSDHPRSPEALLSHVLLGRLLLQQGSAAAASEQYARYLRAAPNGSLAEEALFGQASALRASGRVVEERRALDQLVARFPGSVSARAARARLAELE